jgi:deoxyribodipyrimidine photo-lyase
MPANQGFGQSMNYSVVWFKRDLRWVDHAALRHAASLGPIVCLYIVEPSLWAQPDAAAQHYVFIAESLKDLSAALQKLGGRLHIVRGEAPAVLAQLHAAQPFNSLHSHEETGNDASYQRDIAVGRWCKAQGVVWHQAAQFGVKRGLQNRDRWQAHWQAHTSAPQHVVPATIDFQPVDLPSSTMPSARSLGLADDAPAQRQRGGRSLGLAVLESFLQDRCANYRSGLSSPLSAPRTCSRLSPYLTYGCLSLREVVQAAQLRLATLPSTSTYQRNGLTAFISRLHWHCHFIQKLESEPQLEWRNMHRGYDGLREGDWNAAHFEALVAGRTGWPMVDACVAMLRETGWINFRMRAMLVSVAAYPLWLHWQPVGQWLARQFIDYEPGIHWSQMQMQSGTTGINIARVYNPIKQAQDHDPHGHFVRRWLPAMRRVPDAWLWEPWRMPPDLQVRYGVTVGHDIAQPLVDLDQATREAKARLYALRAQPSVRAAKAGIVTQHGSRMRPAQRTRKASVNTQQLGLDF